MIILEESFVLNMNLIQTNLQNLILDNKMVLNDELFATINLANLIKKNISSLRELGQSCDSFSLSA